MVLLCFFQQIESYVHVICTIHSYPDAWQARQGKTYYNCWLFQEIAGKTGDILGVRIQVWLHDMKAVEFILKLMEL